MFTLPTLLLLDSVLRNTTLNGQADDFEEAALGVIAARRELAVAIASHPDSQEPKAAKKITHKGRTTKAEPA